MAEASFTTLEVTEAYDRVEVRLNRPEARNAMDATMVDELHAVLGSLERRPRFLVVTGGTDGVFAAGADVGDLLKRTRIEALAGPTAEVLDRLAALPMPTVAAVDGHALGGGAELSYACDLRIATHRATFAQPEPRLGILAGGGALRRLPQLVGDSLARQVLLGGRVLTAQEALQAGLLIQVVDPEELIGAAHNLVTKMGRMSADALRLTKLALDASAGASGTERLAQALLFESDEKRRRMTEFLERNGRGRLQPEATGPCERG